MKEKLDGLVTLLGFEGFGIRLLASPKGCGSPVSCIILADSIKDLRTLKRLISPVPLNVKNCKRAIIVSADSLGVPRKPSSSKASPPEATKTNAAAG